MALCVFSEATSPQELFVQELSDLGDAVVGFLKITNPRPVPIRFMGNITSRVGSAPLLGFIAGDGKVLVDSSDHAIETMRLQAAGSAWLSIIIHEAGRNKEGLRAARYLFCRELSRVSNSQEIRTYQESAATRRLWRALEECASGNEGMQEFLRHRSGTRITIDELGNARVRIEGLDLAFFPGFSAEDLIREVRFDIIDPFENEIQILRSREERSGDVDLIGPEIDEVLLKAYLRIVLGGEPMLDMYFYRKSVMVLEALGILTIDDLRQRTSGSDWSGNISAGLSTHPSNITQLEAILNQSFGARFMEAYINVYGDSWPDNFYYTVPTSLERDSETVGS